MYLQSKDVKSMLLVAGLWAAGFHGALLLGQSGPDVTRPAQPGAPSVRARSPYVASQNRSARITYQAFWGIDDIRVSEASSGALLRVTYRIVDAVKAKALHDERSTPYLMDEKTGAVLKIPDMPKVGELRSKMTPVNGKEYWMVFSNKGFVKPGSRVDLVIGTFRAEGLVVH